MSQVKINLQPPPNVDFVTGYPGIPPGPDRPQASVKGAIEVRVPPQGVKAKWVRIELRKVETLPGGGPSNTFYDFVGPSPVNLWSSPDEYTVLRSQDFPFSIRIPESIPPSVALDNKASIAYELVASVCTKGKRGFLRKAKSVVASAIAPITIDKHELHATWPVYCQPEQRQVAQDGVTLTIERSNTCYGPGDRVSVFATIKSDNLHTVILRGYEFFLKESTVFTAGVHAAGRKNSTPQTKLANISESKTPVNATLYGGTQNTQELSFTLSGNHTTTTLNAARHIDVTYTLCVKALMGTGTHIVMELPVIISNWQRQVSYEAINRIGPAPSLSLLPATQAQSLPSRIEPSRTRPTDLIAATLPTNRSNAEFGHVRNSSLGAYNNTLPGGASMKTMNDDLSYTSGYGRTIDDFGSTKPTLTINPSITSVTPSVNTATTRSTGAAARFHVKNIEPSQDSISRNRSAQATGSSASGSSAAPNQWPTAEEEKKRYEDARLGVVKVQGPDAAPPPIAIAKSTASPPPAMTSSPPRATAVAGGSSSAPAKQWLSAEEEKRRLFEKAQEAVQIKQGHVPAQPPPQEVKPQLVSSGSTKLVGAALYQQAVNARSGGSGSGQAGGSLYASPSKAPLAMSPGPQYMTAEQEKAALRRYEEAKKAVEKSQGPDDIPSSNPIAYDSLYPSSKPEAASGSSSQPTDDAPPSFEAAAVGNNIITHLSEKERLRRAYEASDALATRKQSPPPAAYTVPPPAPVPTPAPAPSLSGAYANALEEKEAVRRKLEARDAAAQAKALQKASRNNSAPTNVTNLPASPGRNPNQATGGRPTPQPPTNTGRILTAAEEKALLQAKFDARDGGRKPAPVPASPPPPSQATRARAPPPLMPRPPVEYIKETQDEDLRLSRLNNELVPTINVGNSNGAPKLNGAGAGSSTSSGQQQTSESDAPGIDMKPFTPFRSAFDTPNATPGPPPPLPKSGE